MMMFENIGVAHAAIFLLTPVLAVTVIILLAVRGTRAWLHAAVLALVPLSIGFGGYSLNLRDIDNALAAGGAALTPQTVAAARALALVPVYWGLCGSALVAAAGGVTYWIVKDRPTAGHGLAPPMPRA